MDIQGSEFNMFDPEVASIDGNFEEGELLFCLGNLSKVAYDNFFTQRTCNKFCEMIGINGKQHFT